MNRPNSRRHLLDLKEISTKGTKEEGELWRGQRRETEMSGSNKGCIQLGPKIFSMESVRNMHLKCDVLLHGGSRPGKLERRY